MVIYIYIYIYRAEKCCSVAELCRYDVDVTCVRSCSSWARCITAQTIVNPFETDVPIFVALMLRFRAKHTWEQQLVTCNVVVEDGCCRGKSKPSRRCITSVNLRTNKYFLDALGNSTIPALCSSAFMARVSTDMHQLNYWPHYALKENKTSTCILRRNIDQHGLTSEYCIYSCACITYRHS